MTRGMAERDASQVADLLLEIGRRISLEGGNPYRAKAYIRAAESLRALLTPLSEVIARGELRSLPGVGAAIADAILELREKGTNARLERSRQRFPTGVLELAAIPGLKPRAIVALHEAGVSSLAEAEAAAREGRLRDVKGLGAAAERKIVAGAAIVRDAHGRVRINRAEELLRQAADELARNGFGDITMAGEFRRGCELIGDLRLVATTKTGGPARPEHLGAVRVDIVTRARLGSALLYATGSAQHVAELEALARARGLTLTREGLAANNALPQGRSEEAIYRRLGLPFIAPELREGRGEVAAAQAHRLPEPVRGADLRGILHVHTEFSDGANTIREMAEAARRLGYRYLGVSDHSRSAHYAGGLSIADIARQHAAIDRLNRQFGQRFRILKGIESDILVDGSLDYPDEILASFDFVVASVHGRFRLDREAQTARILKAVSNPFTTILGHPTGRLLLRRPGYDVDVLPILAACARHGVAVEVNGNPNRLELDWRWHQQALTAGCFLSINPDAHSISELDLVRWAVVVARKGGVPKERVLNAMTLAQISRHLQQRKRAAPPQKRPSRPCPST